MPAIRAKQVFLVASILHFLFIFVLIIINDLGLMQYLHLELVIQVAFMTDQLYSSSNLATAVTRLLEFIA